MRHCFTVSTPPPSHSCRHMPARCVVVWCVRVWALFGVWTMSVVVSRSVTTLSSVKNITRSTRFLGMRARLPTLFIRVPLQSTNSPGDVFDQGLFLDISIDRQPTLRSLLNMKTGQMLGRDSDQLSSGPFVKRLVCTACSTRAIHSLWSRW